MDVSLLVGRVVRRNGYEIGWHEGAADARARAAIFWQDEFSLTGAKMNVAYLGDEMLQSVRERKCVHRQSFYRQVRVCPHQLWALRMRRNEI